MTIYTSYFANLRKLPPTITPIGICVSPPYWFKGENYDKLAPSRELLSQYKAGHCTMLDYWDRYWSETLSKLDPVSVYCELHRKGTPDVAILCYEAPSDWCHRFIVSHWFTQANFGVVVREYGNPPNVFGG